MRVVDISGPPGCIYSPPGATDDLPIPKVVLEGIIIGEKQSRSAYPCKRENVLVIGTADALGSKGVSI